MQVTLATVSEKLVDTSCDSVVLPTKQGSIEVFEGHADLLSQLDTGLVRVKSSESKSEEVFVLQSGFAYVDHERVRIIAEFAQRANAIDKAQAEARKQEAEQKLNGELTQEERQRLRAQQSLASAQLNAIKIN